VLDGAPPFRHDLFFSLSRGSPSLPSFSAKAVLGGRQVAIPLFRVEFFFLSNGENSFLNQTPSDARRRSSTCSTLGSFFPRLFFSGDGVFPPLFSIRYSPLARLCALPLGPFLCFSINVLSLKPENVSLQKPSRSCNFPFLPPDHLPLAFFSKRLPCMTGTPEYMALSPDRKHPSLDIYAVGIHSPFPG